jgi:hypothetical protein
MSKKLMIAGMNSTTTGFWIIYLWFYFCYLSILHQIYRYNNLYQNEILSINYFTLCKKKKAKAVIAKVRVIRIIKQILKIVYKIKNTLIFMDIKDKMVFLVISIRQK